MAGTGSHLAKMLHNVGFTAVEGCKCVERARLMDELGCDWCEQHIDTIVGWLREEATRRGLPFLDAAGRLLVRRAIRNARRDITASTPSPNQTGSTDPHTNG